METIQKTIPIRCNTLGILTDSILIKGKYGKNALRKTPNAINLKPRIKIFGIQKSQDRCKGF